MRAVKAVEAIQTRLGHLNLRHWPLAAGDRARATLVLVHGLGEHSGRYAALADALNRWGFDVWGHDHYGHGESDGPRGGLAHDDQLLEDLATVIDHVRAATGSATPLVLLGHSLGGLVASRFVVAQTQADLPLGVQGLVLSSPVLDAGLNLMQQLLVSVLPRVLPDLRVGNGLDAQFLSHDAATVATYLADPLVHDRISARLAQFIDEGGPLVLQAAKRWPVRTLLLYAGTDKLVDPAGSLAFEALAPPEWVESHCFESLFHEIFNESAEEREKVLAVLRKWLMAHFH